MKDLLLPLALLLSACATAAPAPRSSLSFASDLDAAIAHAMTRIPSAPGLSVAVYTREGVYRRGFGITDVTTGEAADTAFYVASSTKAMTGLAFAILNQRGALDLDASLAAYAPDANFAASIRPNEVRLRDLLTHTSGIANNPIGYRVAFSGDHNPEILWRLLGVSTPNAQAPLGTFQYTNVGYNIATVLTDHRLGTPWQDLLQREIFDPAGMTHTSARMSRATALHWSLARPHVISPSGGAERIALEKTDQTMQSAGGVVMSANDAARWLELIVEDGRIDGRQIVPAAAVQSTRTPLANLDDNFAQYTREHYGLGWYLGHYRDEPMVHAFGAFAGFRAHVSYLPDRHIGVSVLINEGTLAAPLVDIIANYIYDKAAGRADARAAFDAAVEVLGSRTDEAPARLAADRAARAARPWTLSHPRAAYAGVYENPDFGTLRINVEGDQIEARIGVLHAVAQAFTDADAVRVELVPFSGEVISFEFAGDETPAAAIFQGARFLRAGAPR
ncbi:MAG: serine hydrolase [Hyphomonadaceae bacterium]|nr:serine hydrolase [Hyphomonadaceae bacterium]